MNEDLALNLRLLCSYYRSIAEVSRRLEISRPQFNRYLSGQYRPAAHTLRRICEFFGVEEHEILLPNRQFQRLVQVRPKPRESQATRVESEPLAQLRRSGASELSRYVGHYYEYYLSMSSPGRILRGLVSIIQREDGVYYQRLERLVERESSGVGVSHCKYQGMAFYLSDRIFMTDYESMTGNEITQTILYPTFTSRVSRLKGLRIGVSASGDRTPASTRVLLEYLGRDIRVRCALKQCGLYLLDSDEIEDAIRHEILNDQAPAGEGPWHFRARKDD
ncbi:helix-turn-helix transcriptional regulator [Cobetia sp. cqz5-12]|uniref:helix-turn-helix transcriptional regulator n=1 Tax=Cobetia sp. cqz5-12 TaxID=2609415 RepID=UPI001907FFD0|nr:helix-turn-helix transcriptional regulator [Cobetia sp. cqz5-12]QQK64412.1 helix-turn-helix transcriptional regulator [Cobetia sp. cqz5-12]